MKNCFLWLSLRLMKRQKLRTAAVFGGILFSSCLLHVFCGLGWYFWIQVHGDSVRAGTYDFRHQILAVLAVLLLLIVFSCSAVLVYNLFSLTFDQKWRSCRRLMTLGAARMDILYLIFIEVVILFVAAVFTERMILYLVYKCAGVCLYEPLWMRTGIDLWTFGLCCFLGLFPALRAFQSPLYFDPAKITPMVLRRSFHRAGRRIVRRKKRASFALFMAHKYFSADRRRYIRITFAIAAAVVLYIPAGYLIHTNLLVEQEEMHRKYGIEYVCHPADFGELEEAVDECRSLVYAAKDADAVFYIDVSGIAFLPSEMLSDRLRDVLEEAGWTESEQLMADSDIYFLEDTCYDEYVKAYASQGLSASSQPIYAVLVNRLIHRARYSEAAEPLFTETALLKEDVKKEVGSNTDQYGRRAAVKIQLNSVMQEGQPDLRRCIQPDVCVDEFPDGISAGNVTVIFPFRSFLSVCEGIENEWAQYNIHVCGLFADMDENLYETLSRNLNKRNLGKKAAGTLRNVRRAYQEWYESLRDLRLALVVMIGLLFFTALIQVFSTVLFHCMQRRHGLAVLWSLGQTKRNLQVIIALESLRSFFYAMLIGLPISGIICYGVYRIYRRVWNIEFMFPIRQFMLIFSALAAGAAAAVAVGRMLLDKQDFLKEIRNI